jgi:hypothetical protein
MSINLAQVLTHRAKEKTQTSKHNLTDLTVVCLWSALGLVLAMVMIRAGFDAEIVRALVIAG